MLQTNLRILVPNLHQKGAAGTNNGAGKHSLPVRPTHLYYSVVQGHADLAVDAGYILGLVPPPLSSLFLCGDGSTWLHFYRMCRSI